MFIVLHFIIVFYSILDSSGFGDKNTIIIENIMHYWKWCSFNIKNARQLKTGFICTYFWIWVSRNVLLYALQFWKKMYKSNALFITFSIPINRPSIQLKSFNLAINADVLLTIICNQKVVNSQETFQQRKHLK